MNCRICGAELKEDAKFCQECGATCEAPAAPAAQNGADPAAPANQAPAANTPNQQTPPPPAPVPSFFDDNLAPIVSTGHWLGTLLLLTLIPVAAGFVAGFVGSLLGNSTLATVLSVLASLTGLIMCFVWAFSGRTNPSKRNYFRAVLIYTAIIVVAVIVLLIIFGAAIMSYLGKFYPEMLTAVQGI